MSAYIHGGGCCDGTYKVNSSGGLTFSVVNSDEYGGYGYVFARSCINYGDDLVLTFENGDGERATGEYDKIKMQRFTD